VKRPVFFYGKLGIKVVKNSSDCDTIYFGNLWPFSNNLLELLSGHGNSGLSYNRVTHTWIRSRSPRRGLKGSEHS
jgi:hypothetical protein